MREIKFRGKVSKGYNEDFFKQKFVYGSAIICEDNISSTIINNEFEAEVNTDTIGQFTGLKDKNGKEIYEGDIVKQEKWVSVGKYSPSVGIIKYKAVGFTCECIGNWLGSNADLNGNAEVIGNIHETPELLGK